jgi:hypothetical protein
MAFDREPIFWTSTRPGYNNVDRERVTNVNGKRIVERVPQRGHQGDYENRRLAKGQRYITAVRHEGHVVSVVMTNGAAHMDPNTEFGLYQKAKMAHLGWYPIGGCPLAALANGNMMPGHFTDQSLLKDVPCPPSSCSEAKPCRHAIAERDARRKENSEAAKEVESKFVDPTTRMIDANREQSTELANIIAKALAGKDSAKK